MRGSSRPFSALIACFAILGMIAGGAVAFPAKFHAIVAKAQQVLHRSAPVDAADAGNRRAGTGSDAGGHVAHRADECRAAIDGVLEDPPGTKDVRGLQHAIAVVEANCEKNLDARGLLNALSHLLADAQKHAHHESHAGGDGHGGSPGNGHGVGRDPSDGGNGHAHGHGSH